MEDNIQKNRVQEDKCEPLQSLPSMNVIPTVQGEEIQKEGGQLLDDVSSNVESKNGSVEWKKAQHILTQLGLQLVPKSMKDSLGGSSSGANGRKGYKELQNLKFNVNYDRGRCSRGTQSSPRRFFLET